jgi:hypothetical protein
VNAGSFDDTEAVKERARYVLGLGLVLEGGNPKFVRKTGSSILFVMDVIDGNEDLQ